MHVKVIASEEHASTILRTAGKFKLTTANINSIGELGKKALRPSHSPCLSTERTRVALLLMERELYLSNSLYLYVNEYFLFLENETQI